MTDGAGARAVFLDRDGTINVDRHYLSKPEQFELIPGVGPALRRLLDAINRYEEGLGAQFETYAVQRIRGSMLDGLRENDWLPRSLRRDMRRIEAAVLSAIHPMRNTPSLGQQNPNGG